MPTTSIDSGISCVGSVSSGAHLCHFYEAPEDLLATLVPFFRAGLQHRELCIWAVTNSSDCDAARRALQRTLPDSGDLEIVPVTELAATGGITDPDRLLSHWLDRLARALGNGYSGMRLVSGTDWLADEEQRGRYESGLSRLVAGRPLLVLCTNRLDDCNGTHLFEKINRHDLVTHRRHGHTELLVAKRSALKDREDHRLSVVLAGVMQTAEQENARLARRLHHELGSLLAGLRWELEDLGSSRPNLDEMLQVVDRTVDGLRQIAWDLSPLILDDVGVIGTLEQVAGQFEARTGLGCRLDCVAEIAELNRDQALATIRIVRAALDEILYSGQATEIVISVKLSQDYTNFCISHDGLGTWRATRTPWYSGLLELVRWLGGAIEPTGNTLTLSMPVVKVSGVQGTG